MREVRLNSILDNDFYKITMQNAVVKLFTNEKGMAKLEIGLCKGKKTYDKRESLKEQDTKRDLDRIKKSF